MSNEERELLNWAAYLLAEDAVYGRRIYGPNVFVWLARYRALPPESTALASADGTPTEEPWRVGQVRRINYSGTWFTATLLRRDDVWRPGGWTVRITSPATYDARAAESWPSELVTDAPDPSPAKRCKDWCGTFTSPFTGHESQSDIDHESRYFCSPECRAAGRPINQKETP